jgi:hypothetical protein
MIQILIWNKPLNINNKARNVKQIEFNIRKEEIIEKMSREQWLKEMRDEQESDWKRWETSKRMKEGKRVRESESWQQVYKKKKIERKGEPEGGK